MFKMICLDLDGTLLNYEKQIDSQTSKLLNKLSSNGVEIVIATGRHYDFASYLLLAFLFRFLLRLFLH